MDAGAGPVKGLQLVESLARSEGLIVDAPISRAVLGSIVGRHRMGVGMAFDETRKES